MRILFLALDVDLSKQRGDAIHTTALASAFLRMGHEVALVVGRKASSLPETIAGITVEASGPDYRILATIQSVLQEFPADTVYERRSTPKIGFAIKTLWGIPFALEVNGLLRDELAYQGRVAGTGPVAGFKDAARSSMLRRVDVILAVSEAIRKDLVNTYRVLPSRIHVIGNGVDTDMFRPAEKAQACGRTGLDPQAPRFVFVGNLAPWRDFDLLISALRLLLPEFTNLHVLIVGDGQEREKIEVAASALQTSAVTLVGEVPHSRIPDLVGASDLCLLPARDWAVDISPLKLFEYLACGRPVVATRVPGLDLVESIGAGRLAPPGDVEAFAAISRELLLNSDLRAEMGHRGRQFVERERSWASVAARISIALQSVAG